MLLLSHYRGDMLLRGWFSGAKVMFLDAACMLGMASSDKEDAVPPHWPRPPSSLAAFEWTDPDE